MHAAKAESNGRLALVLMAFSHDLLQTCSARNHSGDAAKPLDLGSGVGEHTGTPCPVSQDAHQGVTPCPILIN